MHWRTWYRHSIGAATARHRHDPEERRPTRVSHLQDALAGSKKKEMGSRTIVRLPGAAGRSWSLRKALVGTQPRADLWTVVEVAVRPVAASTA